MYTCCLNVMVWGEYKCEEGNFMICHLLQDLLALKPLLGPALLFPARTALLSLACPLQLHIDCRLGNLPQLTLCSSQTALAFLVLRLIRYKKRDMFNPKAEVLIVWDWSETYTCINVDKIGKGILYHLLFYYYFLFN